MLEDSNIQSDTRTDQNEINVTDLKEALKQKHDALLEDINHIDNVISELQAEYSNKIEDLHSKKRTHEEALNHILALLKLEGYSSEETTISKFNNDSPEISITDSAYNLLYEIHHPMHYKDIAITFKDRGIHISGVNPAATLLSRISRDDRFKRVKRGTYGLKGWRTITSRKKYRSRKGKK